MTNWQTKYTASYEAGPTRQRLAQPKNLMWKCWKNAPLPQQCESLPRPGFEPGLLRPQRRVLTTRRSRLLRCLFLYNFIFNFYTQFQLLQNISFIKVSTVVLNQEGYRIVKKCFLFIKLSITTVWAWPQINRNYNIYLM